MRRRLQHFFLILSVIFLLMSLWYMSREKTLSQDDSWWNKLVIILDVSQSMNVTDIESLSRLRSAKEYIYRTLRQYEWYEFALTIFAWESQRVLPFTHDISLVATFIEWLDSSNIVEQGTRIDLALSDALASFNEDELGGNILILTDGSDENISIPDSVTKEIRKKEIQIYVVGVGTKQWWFIPTWDFFEPYKIYNGERVVSRLNETGLQEFTRMLDGKYMEVWDNVELQSVPWEEWNQNISQWIFSFSAISWGIFLSLFIFELYRKN